MYTENNNNSKNSTEYGRQFEALAVSIAPEVVVKIKELIDEGYSSASKVEAALKEWAGPLGLRAPSLPTVSKYLKEHGVELRRGAPSKEERVKPQKSKEDIILNDARKMRMRIWDSVVSDMINWVLHHHLIPHFPNFDLVKKNGGLSEEELNSFLFRSEEFADLLADSPRLSAVWEKPKFQIDFERGTSTKEFSQQKGHIIQLANFLASTPFVTVGAFLSGLAELSSQKLRRLKKGLPSGEKQKKFRGSISPVGHIRTKENLKLFYSKLEPLLKTHYAPAARRRIKEFEDLINVAHSEDLDIGYRENPVKVSHRRVIARYLAKKFS